MGSIAQSMPANSHASDAMVPAPAVDGPGAPVDRAELQRLMWDAAGVLRDGDGLAAASAALAGWKHPAPTGRDATPADLLRAVEDGNLLDLARITVASALAREESRGAHYRADFPESRPELARSQSWVRPVDSDDPFLVLESPERTREAEEAIAC